MIDLRKIANDLNIQRNVVCEVGVYSPESSHIKEMIPESKKVIMIEAQKEHADELKRVYGKFDFVVIHNVAINNKNVDKIKLYRRGEVTFIEGLASPEVQIFNYVPDESTAFYVEGKTFDNYDDGDIDILAVDIEGAEWYVLEKLKSRPKLICLETHYKPPLYVNPHMEEIDEWMVKNNYEKYCEDIGDTVYIKK